MLRGKTAVVTGASRGMGAAFAKRLAAEGAHVALVARDSGKLAEVAGEIEAAGGAATAFPCDVTDARSVAVLGEDVLDRLSAVDVLVNNAGALELSSFLDQTDEQWDRMLEANLNSARRVTRAFLPTMLDRGGRIIFIASNAAKRGFPNHAGYAVAKAGLMALTKVLAVEYGTRGVEVFSVLPGLVGETDMGAFAVRSALEKLPDLEGREDKFWESVNPLSPTGYHPTVREIEDLVLFLASGQGTVLHGTCITADHGFTPY